MVNIVKLNLIKGVMDQCVSTKDVKRSCVYDTPNTFFNCSVGLSVCVCLYMCVSVYVCLYMCVRVPQEYKVKTKDIYIVTYIHTYTYTYTGP